MSTINVPSGSNLAKALASAVDGSTLLLERGGKFRLSQYASVNRNGLTITAGGDTGKPKPIISIPSGMALYINNRHETEVSDIAFSSDNPSDSGVRVVKSQKTSLLRLDISNFTFGSTCEGDNKTRCQDLIVDGCYIHHNYHPAGKHSSGFFSSNTDRITLTGNVFETNGWMPGKGPATPQNHNVYLHATCGPATVLNNVFADASSHGLQQRCGGTCRNNIFWKNPIHLSFGLVNGTGPLTVGGVIGVVDHNVMVGGRGIGSQVRGTAIELANIRQVAVTDNLIANNSVADGFAAISVAACKIDPASPYVGKPEGKSVGIVDLSIRDNRVWAWGKGIPYALDYRIKSGAPSPYCLSILTVQKAWAPGKAVDLQTIIHRALVAQAVANPVAIDQAIIKAFQLTKGP